MDSSATSDAIALITAVQNLKKRFDLYESQVSQFHVGERLLTSARHPMPNSWIFAEHVAGEWSALKELLERKDAAIKARVNFEKEFFGLNFSLLDCKSSISHQG